MVLRRRHGRLDLMRESFPIGIAYMTYIVRRRKSLLLFCVTTHVRQLHCERNMAMVHMDIATSLARGTEAQNIPSWQRAPTNHLRADIFVVHAMELQPVGLSPKQSNETSTSGYISGIVLKPCTHVDTCEVLTHAPGWSVGHA